VPYTPLYNSPLINPDDYSMLLNPPTAPSPPLVTRSLSDNTDLNTNTNTGDTLATTTNTALIPSSTSHVITTGDSLTGDGSGDGSGGGATGGSSTRLHTTTTFNVTGDHATHIAITVDSHDHNHNNNRITMIDGMTNNGNTGITSPSSSSIRRVKPSSRITNATATPVVFPPVAGATSAASRQQQRSHASSSSSSSIGIDNTFVTGIDLGAPLQEMYGIHILSYITYIIYYLPYLLAFVYVTV
jgi:hypothetical protein